MPQNPSRILELASVFYDSCVLFTASDLGIFSKLSELNSATADTLAKALSLNPRGTRLIMDGCVAVGLLEKTGELYQNSSLSNTFLVPGKPGDLSEAIRYNRDVYAAWGNLAQLVKTGNPVEKPQLHLGTNESRTRTFVLSMHARALWMGRALIPLMNLKDRKRLLDVGGGPGTFSVLLAQTYPNLDCTVLDLPDIVKIAEELIELQRMSRRVHTLPGDYHTSAFPGNNDVVNILGVLHQESPESIQQILKKAHDALIPGGLIHVLDVMTDATHTSPKFSALFAVNMALTTDNGWVFSDLELKKWLTDAGFVQIAVQTLPAPMPHWLVSARKAS
ncbi:MAG: methyltransferase [Desulfobacterales bacterium]|nr:methyltransferase [Desulfobacterales bacterium]